jgi:hypothetical protein
MWIYEEFTTAAKEYYGFLAEKLKLKESLKLLLKKQTISLLQMRSVAFVLAISINKIRVSTTG